MVGAGDYERGVTYVANERAVMLAGSRACIRSGGLPGTDLQYGGWQ